MQGRFKLGRSGVLWERNQRTKVLSISVMDYKTILSVSLNLKIACPSPGLLFTSDRIINQTKNDAFIKNVYIEKIFHWVRYIKKERFDLSKNFTQKKRFEKMETNLENGNEFKLGSKYVI